MSGRIYRHRLFPSLKAEQEQEVVQEFRTIELQNEQAGKRIDKTDEDLASLEDRVAQNETNIVALDGRVTAIENLPPMRMLAAYAPYQQVPWGTVVHDSGWLMHANKDTSDRAAPIVTGESAPGYPDEGIISLSSKLAKVRVVQQYVMEQSGWFNRLEVLPSEESHHSYPTEDYYFDVGVIHERGGQALFGKQLTDVSLSQKDVWTAVGAIGNEVLLTGDVVTLVFDQVNRADTTVWTHFWVYTGRSNNAGPIPGAWNRNNQQNVLRLNFVDDDSVDQDAAGIMDLVTGTTITITNEANVVEQAVYRTTDLGVRGVDSWEYPVTLVVPADIDEDARCTVHTSQPVAGSTRFERDLNAYPALNPAWATITGALYYDDVEQPGHEDDAYGIRLWFTPGQASPDWDYMSGG